MNLAVVSIELANLVSLTRCVVERDRRDCTDRTWLVATMVSFVAAYELEYETDKFPALEESEQISVFRAVLSEPVLLEARHVQDHARVFLAGHYFNNAVYRTMALAETRLQRLHKQFVSGSAGNLTAKRLIDWYQDNYECLPFLSRARRQMNINKHEETQGIDVDRPLESLSDGLSAYRELLGILDRVLASEYGSE